MEPPEISRNVLFLSILIVYNDIADSMICLYGKEVPIRSWKEPYKTSLN